MSWSIRCFHTPLHEAHTSLAMRRLMGRFWSPFCRRHVGPDLRSYGFTEVFQTICTQDNFTCQVNGQVGDDRLIEDFFIVLLCGFDFADVHVEQSSLTDALGHPHNFKGTYTLAHTRPFLGWRPPSVVPRLAPSSAVEAAAAAAADTVEGGIAGEQSDTPRSAADAACEESVAASSLLQMSPSVPLVKVPFSARLEGTEHHISHMILRSPALDVITSDANCPATVQRCLENPEALRVLVSLRRANVRPDIITDKTLLGITTKKEAWSSALGIL
ncbi:hypothetical protein DQ04_00861000 [Trypanosoma grayi]|uniref:hypothetical protein n=1 Tax=Trypanosoma grayi TaxID=71804 RepID=UPI0004F3F52B|nr:hypothetical protein DQ04_00861000 [Trypanosoma grayi]KEG13658.1 hypothetical protein DQ04_00861000 [Trypanosoma grayi]